MSDAQPQVAVVVATHNRVGRLGELLESLRAQTLEAGSFEVVVVDDASGDETPELLAREVERGELRLRALRHDTSRGPAVARNAGWRASLAPLVAFTDDDCVVAADWLEALVAAARANPGAILQGRTDPRPDEVDSLGPFSYSLTIHSAGPEYQTCNIAYARDLLDRLDGFDEEFSGAGGEDIDLAWRSIELGTPTVFVKDAQAYHAVVHLGPMGKLRFAGRWTESILPYARHPALRRHLVKGLFWAPTHYWLLRALVAALLPRRWWPVKWWLASPYVAHVVERRSGPLLAPYVIAYDVIEIVGVVRGAVRYRTLVL